MSRIRPGRTRVALAILAIGMITVVALLFLRPAASAPAAEILRAAATARPAGTAEALLWDAEAARAQDPDRPDAQVLVGFAALQQARETGDPAYYSRAQAAFDAALARDAAHPDALIGAGALALARHDFAVALALGERAVAAAPFTARAYGLVADAQIELGEYDAATGSLQKMVDLRPDLSAYSRIAYIRELYGDVPGAISAMQQAVAAGGPVLENTEWTRVQLGNLYAGSGDLVAAERIYNEALFYIDGYVPALVGLARIRAAQGNTTEAFTLYQAALQRLPLAEYAIAYGELLEASGQEDAAQQQYDLVRAIQQLQRSSGVDVDLELALFEADHGDPQAALAMARNAYERRPGIRGAEALAWAAFRTGDLEQAQLRITEALRLGTRDAVLLYRAGAIAAARGDADTARRQYTEALAINPEFSPLFAPLARQAST